MMIEATADGATTALNPTSTIADSVLLDFVRALAKRQARIDSAFDSEPRTLH